MKRFNYLMTIMAAAFLVLAEIAYFQDKYFLAIFIMVKGIYLTTVFAWLEARGDNFE